MARYFAFLRGINIGGHTVKMDRLRKLFEAQGFDHPETFIASGNVVFESEETSAAALERAIEAMLAADLGYAVAAFVRSPSQLRKVVRTIASHEAELVPGDSMYVSFFRKPLPVALRRQVEARSNDVDRFVVDGRELYWRIHGKLMDSKVGAEGHGKALGPVTVRNVSTVQKLAAKYGIS
jgi:uncharacterized protein (DUF1697 family)